MRKVLSIGLVLVLSSWSTISQSQSCPDTAKFDVPSDPSMKGPFQVGARTIQIGRLGVEVWYPIDSDTTSQLGEKKVYDIREHLPDNHMSKIPDAEEPFQYCDCYDQAQPDLSSGPFPVLIYVHGTASFRTASLTQFTHWASRGFIVMSADNPYIRPKDILKPLGTIGMLRANQKKDTQELIDAVQQNHPALAFLEPAIAKDRIGLSGHSAGAGAISSFTNTKAVKILIPMAGGSPKTNGLVKSTLVLAAVRDGVGSYDSAVSSYESLVGKKRLVGLKNAGHLAFSDICFIQSDKGGMLEVADKYGVPVPSIVRRLGVDGCGDGYLSPEAGWEIINYVSTAAFEETLACSSQSPTSFDQLPAHIESNIELRQSL